MLFNSFTFFVFFACVFVIARAIPNWKIRKGFFLIISYGFYAAWNPPFVALLWISTTADWFLAKRIHKATARARSIPFVLSLLVNLGILGYFKYGTFILDNFVFFIQTLGIDYTPAKPDIVLPIGISFYTFRSISYTFDVFRRKAAPWHSFLDYALYVSFFPQLLAGPISRSTHFLPQCEEPKSGSIHQVGWGLTLFVIGLFNKVVVADTLMVPIVKSVFDTSAVPGFSQAWTGALAFSIQIFCDFSGYSACAIGIALCLGFNLPVNFRFPYGAIGFSDFWRRWHITLSSWLRDYVYIAMGGNRSGQARTYRNLMLTMLVGGLWHGASWLFVIWGGIHGAYLLIERWAVMSPISKLGFWDTKGGRMFLSLLTFCCVCVAWVYFRASSLDHAWTITASMLGMGSLEAIRGNLLSPLEFIIVIGVTVVTLTLHGRMRDTSLESVARRLPWAVQSLILAGLMYAISISFMGDDRAFIYFQF